MFKKIFKIGKNVKTDEIVGNLKKSENILIENVNKELKKMYLYNEEFYKICVKKEGATTGYLGCKGCNDCRKFNGVI